jgi:hypothetical protein
VVDRNGVPLGVTISEANVHNSQLLEETVDAIPPRRDRIDRREVRESAPRSSMPTRGRTTGAADRRRAYEASSHA